jgi:hypothetical protein
MFSESEHLPMNALQVAIELLDVLCRTVLAIMHVTRGMICGVKYSCIIITYYYSRLEYEYMKLVAVWHWILPSPKELTAARSLGQ